MRKKKSYPQAVKRIMRPELTDYDVHSQTVQDETPSIEVQRQMHWL